MVPSTTLNISDIRYDLAAGKTLSAIRLLKDDGVKQYEKDFAFSHLSALLSWKELDHRIEAERVGFWFACNQLKNQDRQKVIREIRALSRRICVWLAVSWSDCCIQLSEANFCVGGYEKAREVLAATKRWCQKGDGLDDPTLPDVASLLLQLSNEISDMWDRGRLNEDIFKVSSAESAATAIFSDYFQGFIANSFFFSLKSHNPCSIAFEVLTNYANIGAEIFKQ